jgi:hypothetical protein
VGFSHVIMRGRWLCSFDSFAWHQPCALCLVFLSGMGRGALGRFLLVFGCIWAALNGVLHLVFIFSACTGSLLCRHGCGW